VPLQFSPPVVTTPTDSRNGLMTFTADLAPFLPTTATSITLRIHVEDASGNWSEYDVEDAAVVNATDIPSRQRSVRR
jgi:hypothetical protein